MFPKNADVNVVNDKRIAQLPTPVMRFICRDHFNWKDEHKNNPYLKMIDERRPRIVGNSVRIVTIR